MHLAPRLLSVITTLLFALAVAPVERSEALTTLIADESGLGNIYVERIYEETGQVCSRRFPDLATSLRGALQAWRKRHAVALAEMSKLHADLHQAARASPPINGLLDPDRLARRAMLPSEFELYNLAGANDARARLFCEKRRADLDDDDQTSILFITARETARDLLTKKGRDTEDYEQRQRLRP